MQPPTEPKTQNTTTLLPAEIIFAICSCFKVHPQNPAAEYRLSLSTRDNIRALRQLSLTCRAIHDEVTPTLYRSIYFTGPMTENEHLHYFPLPTKCQHPGAENLVYFLRTILENPGLRRHVKDVACLFNLRAHAHTTERMSTDNKDYGILRLIQECKDVTTQSLLDRADEWISDTSRSRIGFRDAFSAISRRPIITLSHQIFALIACLLPNLTSISLKIGVSFEAPSYPMSPRLYDLRPGIHPIGGGRTREFRGSVPLQNLRTLQVRYEPIITANRLSFSLILLNFIPIVLTAPNLTQVRSYGPEPAWEKLPPNVTSFESWGTGLNTPLGAMMPWIGTGRLKTVVIHFDCTSMARGFNFNYFCGCLSRRAPALEHLKVLLSPGTCTQPNVKSRDFSLHKLRQLQYFCLDTRIFSENHWNKNDWQDEELGLKCLPSSIEILDIVDSEPRCNLDSILKWLQAITRMHLRPEMLSKLKRVEYLHMSPLDGANCNGGNWSSFDLANEVKRELALYGVEFQLSLVNNKGGGFSGAELPEHNDVPVQACIHGAGA